MPGDEWQRFANLRAYYAFMFGHPGKNLLFMGDEFGQLREWDHDSSLDWDLLDADQHRGVQRLVRDLNLLYCSVPALHELDYDASGFEWADWQSADISVLAFLRFDRQGRHALCVTNFTPVVRYDYRVGVPAAGSYRERLNTDAADYGGSGVGNMGAVLAKADNEFASPASMQITLPPLATVLFTPAQD
jgi:1,4-alpha-glucan branching enzyme